MSFEKDYFTELQKKDDEIKILKNVIKKLKSELEKEKNRNKQKINPCVLSENDWENHLDILKSTNYV